MLGVLAPFVFVALFTLFMMCRPVRALGMELRLWCACYMGYLLVFLHPQTSTFRMLLPLFPLALGCGIRLPVPRLPRHGGRHVPAAADCLDRLAVGLGPLPGGGDYPP